VRAPSELAAPGVLGCDLERFVVETGRELHEGALDPGGAKSVHPSHHERARRAAVHDDAGRPTAHRRRDRDLGHACLDTLQSVLLSG